MVYFWNCISFVSSSMANTDFAISISSLDVYVDTKLFFKSVVL